MNVLHLFTFSEDYETGANHVIVDNQCVLTRLSDIEMLSKRVVIEVDNCTPENKNEFCYLLLSNF